MTDTVAFWSGSFGDDYLERNPASADRVDRACRLWSQILGPRTDTISSVMEVGANVGTNLLALERLLPAARLFAVEPNAKAREQLIESGVADELDVYRGLGDATGTVDLILTCGVLIHIHPDALLDFCQRIHAHAGRYLACVEYFAAEPEEKLYRGHAGKLWKRDFGSFYMEHFPDLVPINHGFAWKKVSGLDNLTWVLFERCARVHEAAPLQALEQVRAKLQAAPLT